jgi:hypothetical protein
MKTVQKEIQVGQTILLSDGNIDKVDDFDGSFYFLKNSDESILHHTIVDVVVEENPEMEKYLKNMELIQATETYSLYIDRKTNEISVYNGDDICSMHINDFGNWAFKN